MMRTLTILCLSACCVRLEAATGSTYDLQNGLLAAVCAAVVLLLLVGYLLHVLRRNQRMCSEVRREHAELKMHYAEKSQAYDELDATHRKLEEACNELTLTLEKEQMLLDEAGRRYDTLRGGYTDLQERCARLLTLEREHADLKEAHAHRLDEGREKDGEIARLEAELTECRRTVERLKQQEENMRTELLHAHQLLHRHEEEQQRRDNPEGAAAAEPSAERLTGGTRRPTGTDVLPWNSNDEFLAQIVRFMRENMDNAGLSIELFAKRMNISRSMLYRKIKSVTGLTPVEFMHRVRIAYAIELLRGDYNFSQIAYMTGFNDPKYFTKCFKRYTGMTPSDWKEKRTPKADKANKEILSHNNSYQFANYFREDLSS